jgi:hypothetical protein
MPDYRKSPRATAKQSALALVSGRAAVECTIRDMSSTGARLSFRHPIFLPRTFRLRFDTHDQLVTVVWQGALFAGVRFQSPIAGLAARPRRFSLFAMRR